MKLLLNLAAILAAAYAVITLAAFLFQDRLLFFPRPLAPRAREALAEHAVRFDHDGVALHGWLHREQEGAGRPFLIYFGFSHPHDTRDGKPELLEKYGLAATALADHKDMLVVQAIDVPSILEQLIPLSVG